MSKQQLPTTVGEGSPAPVIALPRSLYLLSTEQNKLLLSSLGQVFYQNAEKASEWNIVSSRYNCAPSHPSTMEVQAEVSGVQATLCSIVS